MDKFMNRFRMSLNWKLTSISIVCLLGAMIVITVFNQNNVHQLTEKSLTTMEKEFRVLVEEYYDNYIGEISGNIEKEMTNITKENQLAASMVQKTFDYQDQFIMLGEAVLKQPYFKDTMTYSGSWYQNQKDEPTVIFVPGSQVGKDGQLSEGSKKLMQQTAILDFVMPSFVEHGVEKLQLYFQGNDIVGVTRLAPWVNMGETIFDVYPELNTLPMWETFNPGLIDDYQQAVKELVARNESPYNISKASAPVQDALTGEIVISFGTPIFSDNYTKFEGGVSYDVPITAIINRIEQIKLSDNGFAFLSQSNGNVFAVKDSGASLLGLQSGTSKDGVATVGFNRLKRFIADSSFEGVKKIPINKEGTIFTEIEIDGKAYLIITKPFRAYQTWNTEQKFYDEHWTLGFAVPVDEVFKVFKNVDSQVDANLQSTVVNTLSLSAIMALVVVIIIAFMNSRLTRKLNTLAISTTTILNREDDSLVEVNSIDEIGVLANAFNIMKKDVRQSFSQLVEAQQEIENLHAQEKSKLETLVNEKTKSLEKLMLELNEREKLASLGSLVSGVSHEINTPLGIAITATSFLSEVNETFYKKLQNNDISRTDFEDYVKSINQSSSILEHNLGRAAKLVNSFKEIAVHQSIEEQMPFNMSEYLDMVVTSLHHETKKQHHKVVVNCEPGLIINSYAGAFSQIITNLMMNAIVHGHDESQNNHLNILIDFKVNGDLAILTFGDDGKGISEEHISHIFEPFYTTKRGLGGSGLGLNIVYNLVTGLLHGNIHCESKLGEGSRFIIEFPVAK